MANHSKITLHERKCPKCGHWSFAQIRHCPNCGHDLDAESELKEEEKVTRMESGKLDLPLIPINEKDHLLLKMVKYPIRMGQIVFYAIAGAIAWMAYWAAL